MPPADSERAHGVVEAHGGDRGARYLVVADGVGVPEPKLPAFVLSPTARRAVRHDHAGVISASDDRDDRGPELDLRVLGRRGLVVADVVGVPEPELSEVILAPAPHRPVDHQRAGVLGPGGDGGRGRPQFHQADLEGWSPLRSVAFPNPSCP